LLTSQRLYEFPRNVEKQLLMILQDDPVPIRERCLDVPDTLSGDPIASRQEGR
jgi:hypothetical protein